MQSPLPLSAALQPFWSARIAIVAAAILFSNGPEASWAQTDFERAPIHYSTATPSNPVSRLQERLDSGEAELSFDKEQGFLASVLEQLGISRSSQILVFSKTSFQPHKISPRRPRAVYFGDDVFVGWVQGGSVVEISTADPQLGAVFYTLKQDASSPPVFLRDRGECISCHASARTASVPGHLVRSVFSDPAGQPHFGAGTFTTDYRSPFLERWGGWYVTGVHGKARHMGNVVSHSDDAPENLDVEAGANVTDLSNFLKTDSYLTSHSDIVALMVLEHQTRMHNLITRASFETRCATYYDGIMNKALDQPLDQRSDSTNRRIDAAVNEMVDCMLFVDEFPLQDPVQGSSQFSQEFASRGPKDSRSRSLRDLDLTHRLLKYPCSYLIYSDPFDKLPSVTKEQTYNRLHEVLSGADMSEKYGHQSASDRRAILEILNETKSDLPDSWMAN